MADERAHTHVEAAGSAPRSAAITQLCSWCGRVQRDGEWVTLEADAVKPLVSHGVCPECFERVLRAERERR
jgi:hypothetical protein